MVTLSKKILATIIIIAVVIALIAFAAIFNVGNFGASMAGAGGPVAAGFYNLSAGFLKWALSGGWPTLAVFYLLGLIVIPFSFAFIIWHFDVPYKITGAATATNPASGYNNLTPREPAEPERAPLKP